MHTQITRPAALFTLPLLYAGFLSAILSGAPRFLPLAAALFLLLLTFFTFLPIPLPVRRTARLVLSGAALGCLLFLLYAELSLGHTLRLYRDTSESVTGTVVQREYATSYDAGYTVRIETVEDARVSAFLILLDAPDTTLQPGERIGAEVDFSEFSPYAAGFAEQRYYYARDIRLRGEAEEVALLGRTSLGVRGFFAELRATVTAYFTAHLGRDGAALPAAMLLGDRSLMPDTLTRDFRRLGISHLLAISGYHFTVLLGGLSRLLTPLIPRRRGRIAVLLAADGLYLLLTGMSEAVVRAGLMFALALLAQLLHRSSDMLTSLGVSGALIVLCSPSAFFSVGFQLSVSAVVAMACVGKTHLSLTPHRRGRMGRMLFAAGDSLLISLAVQILLLPLFCLYFGEVSLLAPLATLLFSLPMNLILLLSPLVLLGAFPPLCSILVGLCDVTASAAAALGALRGISVSLSYPFAPIFCCALAGAVCLLPFLRRKKQRIRLLLLALGICVGFGGSIAFAQSVQSARVTVETVTKGKNDILLVQSRGMHVLCDFSDGSFGALREGWAAAQKKCATEVEALLLTHLHRRHIQSLIRLSEMTYVRALILPQPQTEGERDIVLSLREEAERRGIPLFTYDADAGDTVQIGDATLMPLPRRYLSRSTHPTVGIRVAAYDRSMLYLGTSLLEAEDVSIPAADTVVFGVHGPIAKKEYTLPPQLAQAELYFLGDSGAMAAPSLSARGKHGACVLRFTQASGKDTEGSLPERAG